MKLWSLAALSAVAGLGVLGGVYGFIIPRSQTILDRRYPAAPSAVHAVASPEAVALGEHLVRVTDCAACHGEHLAGGPMTLSSATILAPNLTLVGKTKSDAALDAAVRQGLRTDGRSELAMPSQAYASFSDSEMAAIIAYLRTLPPRGATPQQPPYGLLLRMNLATGALKTEVARLAEAKPPIGAGARVEAGRHLAAVACGQCHGTDLKGGPGLPAPDMTVRTYFDRKQFHALMRTGDGSGERNGLMSQTAASSFVHFTDPEIDGLYDYLMARDQLLGVKPGA